MKALLVLFIAFCVSALSCESNQYYVKIVKTSGSTGSTETFSVSATIDGTEQVLITGVPVPPNTNATTEHCVTKVQSGEYTLTLGQADNALWSPSSSIVLTNEDGVVVFSGTKYSSKSAFPFKLSYLVPSGSSAYVLTQFEMREWWTRDFTMDENWVLTSTATPRTYEGNHIYRYSFDVADLAKYSHMVIRVKYRYGIALWINSQRLLRERLQEEDEDAVYMWTMATSSASTYEWEDLLIPASMLDATNNVLVISAHYPDYEEYTVQLTFSVFGVYASYDEEQCSPLPVSLVQFSGLKVAEGNEAEAVVDGNQQTKAVFKAATMQFTVQTAARSLLSEYTVYRSGEDMVESWRVMNRGAEDVSGFQWRLSAARDETSNVTGLYRYYCNEATNQPSTHFRFVLQTLDGSMKDSSVNEFTPFLCGSHVDLTMYSATSYHVTGEDQISMAPEYPVEEATYSIYPPLPEGVTLNESTGAISGSTAHFWHFTSYTVIRSVAGVKTKFFFTVLSDKEDPTPAPTLPPTAAPTDAPTTAPTTAPTNWVVIGTAIAIVVIVILVIVIVCCCRKSKKELPTKESAAPKI